MAACDSAADLPRVTRERRLRRKKGSVLYASNYSLAAFRCSRNPAAAIAMAHDRSRQSLDGTSTPSRPPRRLMATVLLKHRSDLDPIYWKFVIDRSWREADIRQSGEALVG